MDRAGEAAAEFTRMAVDVIVVGGDSEGPCSKTSNGHDTDRREELLSE